MSWKRPWKPPQILGVDDSLNVRIQILSVFWRLLDSMSIDSWINNSSYGFNHRIGPNNSQSWRVHLCPSAIADWDFLRLDQYVYSVYLINIVTFCDNVWYKLLSLYIECAVYKRHNNKGPIKVAKIFAESRFETCGKSLSFLYKVSFGSIYW